MHSFLFLKTDKNNLYLIFKYYSLFYFVFKYYFHITILDILKNKKLFLNYRTNQTLNL